MVTYLFSLLYIGQPVSSMLHPHGGLQNSDLSNDSSPTGYPDFPPSPESWLGESGAQTNQNTSTTVGHY